MPGATADLVFADTPVFQMTLCYKSTLTGRKYGARALKALLVLAAILGAGLLMLKEAGVLVMSVLLAWYFDVSGLLSDYIEHCTGAQPEALEQYMGVDVLTFDEPGCHLAVGCPVNVC